MESLSKKKFSEGDIEDSFAVMGCPNIAEWAVVHKAYLSLARKWHPDRTSANPELANEKIRELNKAYSVLKAYFREIESQTANSSASGPQHRATNTEGDTGGQTAAGEQIHSEPEVVIPRTKEGFRTHPKVKAAPKKKVKARSKKSQKPPSVLKPLITGSIGAILVMGVAGSIYIKVIQPKMNEQKQQPRAQVKHSSSLLAPELATKFSQADKANLVEVKQQDKPKTFDIGDSNAAVLEIQGYPDLTADSVWYYGESAVVFEDGKVISWTLDSRSPLKIPQDKQ